MTTKQTDKLAQEMAGLLETHFLGRRDIYAVQNVSGDYTVFRNPLITKDLLNHCKGQWTIAGYLVNDIGNSPLAVLDIDDRGDAAQSLALYLKAWLAHFKITALIEDSGRKGYHVWVIFKCFVPARKASQLFNVALEQYKKDHGALPFQVEVPFPKQSQASIEHPGNAIKLPWGIHQVTKNKTFFVDGDFAPLPDSGIHQVVDAPRITELDLDAILAEFPDQAQSPAPGRQAVIPTKAQLPCFGKMMEGVEEGVRHIASLRLACHLCRQGMPAVLALSTLLEWDHNFNRPPLGSKHIERSVQDGYTGKYKLGCADIEAAGLCSPECPVYRKRYLEGDQKVESKSISLQTLTKIKSHPPTYRAAIDGLLIELNPEELLRLSLFKKKVMMELDFIPQIGMTQKQWEEAVDEKLREVVSEEAPADAADRVEVVDLVRDWLEEAPKAEASEDVQSGRPVERDNTFYFRAKDVVGYLRARHQVVIRPSALWSVIRDAGGHTKSIRVGAKSFTLWALPKGDDLSEDGKPELDF